MARWRSWRASSIGLRRSLFSELHNLLSDLGTTVVQVVIQDVSNGLRPVRSSRYDLGEERRGQYFWVALLLVKLIEEGQTVSD